MKMNEIEAYYTVKEALPNRNYLIECLDFGEFYGFAFSEEKLPQNEMFGSGYDCIDKNTGEIFSFVPTQNLKLFRKAKTINLSNLN